MHFSTTSFATYAILSASLSNALAVPEPNVHLKHIPENPEHLLEARQNSTSSPPCGDGLGQQPCPPSGPPCGDGLGQQPCTPTTTVVMPSTVMVVPVEATPTPPPPPPPAAPADPCAGAPEMHAPGMPCGPALPTQPADSQNYEWNQPGCGWAQDGVDVVHWAIRLPWNDQWMAQYSESEATSFLTASLHKSSTCNAPSFMQTNTNNTDVFEVVFGTANICTAYDMSWVIGQTTGKAFPDGVACTEYASEAEVHPDIDIPEPGESEPDPEVKKLRRNLVAQVQDNIKRNAQK